MILFNMSTRSGKVYQIPHYCLWGHLNCYCIGCEGDQSNQEGHYKSWDSKGCIDDMDVEEEDSQNVMNLRHDMSYKN